MIDLEILEKAATFYEGCPTGQYDAEAALALRAGEVMMRRGWTARQISDGWLVQDDRNNPLLQCHKRKDYTDWFVADDPFTALVEADKWYEVNVEKSCS